MRTLGYGIIAVGKVSFRHMDVVEAMAGVRLVALADHNVEKAGRIAADRPSQPLVYQDWHDLLKNPEVDVVVVCLPTHLHAEATIAAANAGRHIYCEKAMAPTLRECRAMIAAAQANRVKLNIGQNTRFFPHYAQTKRLIEAGEVGEIIAVNATFTDKAMLRDEVGEDFWRYKVGAKGHGAVVNFGCHWVDTARHLAGQDPVRVSAHIANRYSCDPEDQFVITALCDGGALLTIGDYAAPAYTADRANGFTVYGSQGLIHAWPANAEGVILHHLGAEPITVPIDEDLQVETWLRFHMQFIRSIREDTPAPVSGEDAMRNVEWALAAYLAHEGGCWVDLPLGPERDDYHGPVRTEEVPPGGK